MCCHLPITIFIHGRNQITLTDLALHVFKNIPNKKNKSTILQQNGSLKILVFFNPACQNKSVKDKKQLILWKPSFQQGTNIESLKLGDNAKFETLIRNLFPG